MVNMYSTWDELKYLQNNLFFFILAGEYYYDMQSAVIYYPIHHLRVEMGRICNLVGILFRPPAGWPNDIVRVAGRPWMRLALGRLSWRAKDVTYTQQWALTLR